MRSVPTAQEWKFTDTNVPNKGDLPWHILHHLNSFRK